MAVRVSQRERIVESRWLGDIKRARSRIVAPSSIKQALNILSLQRKGKRHQLYRHVGENA